jgi:hypothetical protein
MAYDLHKHVDCQFRSGVGQGVLDRISRCPQTSSGRSRETGKRAAWSGFGDYRGNELVLPITMAGESVGVLSIVARGPLTGPSPFYELKRIGSLFAWPTADCADVYARFFGDPSAQDTRKLGRCQADPPRRADGTPDSEDEFVQSVQTLIERRLCAQSCAGAPGPVAGGFCRTSRPGGRAATCPCWIVRGACSELKTITACARLRLPTERVSRCHP